MSFHGGNGGSTTSRSEVGRRNAVKAPRRGEQTILCLRITPPGDANKFNPLQYGDIASVELLRAFI